MEPEPTPLLAVDAVTRDFPAVRALDRVSLAFRAGRVHGLIGENGAGKSTLMNVLSGLIEPTAGGFLLEGRPVRFRHPREARDAGVAMVHQELNQVPDLTVADTLFLGRERTRWGVLARREAETEAARVLAGIGCDLSPRRRIRSLSIAQRQMVEIAKALSQNARVLILDEPTAVLSRPEVERLFDLIRDLRGRGVCIIYISHMLPEVLSVCDDIHVLRDGTLVASVPNDGRTDERRLANLMVGRDMTRQFPDLPTRSQELVLKVDHLHVPGRVHGVSFDLRRGEILGLAGLVGSGRTELAEALAGLRPRGGGEVRLDDRPLRPERLDEALDRGLAYLSEDRQGKGVVLGMPVAHNVTLPSLARFARPFLRLAEEVAVTRNHVQRLGIRVRSVHQRIGTLSGGNQQKVALARWLETGPRVLILDEPTRGVDVGAKAEIYRLIADLAEKGLACLLISSELHEVLGLCHRIAVMRAGRIVDMLDGPSATEEAIMHRAAGVEAAA